MARRSKLPVPPRPQTDTLLEAWGTPVRQDLLDLALIHRSYANEAGGIAHNERLEFLGDSVLSIVIADELFHRHVDVPESELSRMRAATVSQEPLAQAARHIELGEYIYLGRGESTHGGRDKDSILSDTFEALVGATYLSVGLDGARETILRHLGFLLVHAVERAAEQDWKTTLTEFAFAHDMGAVTYEVEGEGPDHQRVFTAHAHVASRPEQVGQGVGSSKKHAENAAAADAVARLTRQRSRKKTEGEARG